MAIFAGSDGVVNSLHLPLGMRVLVWWMEDIAGIGGEKWRMKGKESRALVDGDRGGECAILGMGTGEWAS